MLLSSSDFVLLSIISSIMLVSGVSLVNAESKVVNMKNCRTTHGEALQERGH
jgi:hypothetical protein